MSSTAKSFVLVLSENLEIADFKVAPFLRIFNQMEWYYYTANLSVE